MTSVGFRAGWSCYRLVHVSASPALGVRGRGSYLIHYHCWLKDTETCSFTPCFGPTSREKRSSVSSVIKMLLVIIITDYRALKSEASLSFEPAYLTLTAS